MDNWSFDLKNDKARFWRSANHNNDFFKGTVKEGLNEVCEKRSFIWAVLVYLFKNLTFLLFAGASIFSVLVILWQIQYENFDPNEACYSSDYPFWWDYTHSFGVSMTTFIAGLVILLIFTYFSNKWRKSDRRN